MRQDDCPLQGSLIRGCVCALLCGRAWPSCPTCYALEFVCFVPLHPRPAMLQLRHTLKRQVNRLPDLELLGYVLKLFTVKNYVTLVSVLVLRFSLFFCKENYTHTNILYVCRISKGPGHLFIFSVFLWVFHLTLNHLRFVQNNLC